ncbi:MAG: hypothetical protein H0S85_00750 [Desulfovibrionaceae bacterium]|jgi:hypothetical protein|nr:hypothetical protein [Desulfovibrionaceae bacterium]
MSKNIFRTALLLLALLMLAAPAMAGGVSNEKQCSKDYPEGSYLDKCNNIYWDAQGKLHMTCGTAPVNRCRITTTCSFVKNCHWKLENPYLCKLVCE